MNRLELGDVKGGVDVQGHGELEVNCRGIDNAVDGEWA